MPTQTYFARPDRFAIDVESPVIRWENGRRVVENDSTLAIHFDPIGPVGAGSKFTTSDPNLIKVLDAKCEQIPERRFLSKAAASATKTRKSMERGVTMEQVEVE